MYGSNRPIYNYEKENEKTEEVKLEEKEKSKSSEENKPTQKIYGKCWAVVTGPTNSLGLEYCKQIASKGFNICMIDHDKQALSKIESDLKSSYPDIKTMVIQFTFRDSEMTYNRSKYISEI